MTLGDDSLFSESQSKAISLVSRVTASMSFLAAAYIAYKCFQNRQRMFHRLMLGLSFHLLLSNTWQMYGTAAVPPPSPEEDFQNVWGAKGTIETCSAQGFFAQLSFAVPFYYVGLSFYSFQAVRHNFQVSRYRGTEYLIHTLANGLPLSTAIYLLSEEAFNPSPHLTCYIHSVPLACEDIHKSDIECTRGPKDIERLALIFAAIPSCLMLFLPVIVMRFFVQYVRTHQSTIFVLQWKEVAKQAALYLLGFYWTYLLAIINNGFQWWIHQTNFPLAFVSVINNNLEGVWMLLYYIYFAKSTSRKNHNVRHGFSFTEDEEFDLDSSIRGLSGILARERAQTSRALTRTTIVSEDDAIGNDENSQIEEVVAESSHKESQSPRIKNDSKGKRKLSPRPQKQSKNKSQEETISPAFAAASFNIFDGTNASGPFAAFIFEGDEEDERRDTGETEHWDAVQSHL